MQCNEKDQAKAKIIMDTAIAVKSVFITKADRINKASLSKRQITAIATLKNCESADFWWSKSYYTISELLDETVKKSSHLKIPEKVTR